MIKNVLIVNGNREYAKELKKSVLEVNSYVEVLMAYDMNKASEYLLSRTIDLFILDTVLHFDNPGDISGIHLAEQIRQITKYILTPIIFVTAKEDPELYAFEELNCIGYLVKPFAKERFQEIVKRGLCYRTYRNEDKAIIFRRGGAIYPIRVRDIIYIESLAHSMYIHIADGSEIEVLYKTYASILQEADSEYLFRCSRGVVVNKNYIYSLDFANGYIMLKNNYGKVDIGCTYKKRIKEEIADLIF